MPIEPQKALAARFAPSTSAYEQDDVILYRKQLLLASKSKERGTAVLSNAAITLRG